MNFGPLGKQAQSRRRFINIRYRLYVSVIGLLLLFTFAADTFNVAPADVSQFTILSQNPFFTEVKSELNIGTNRTLYAVVQRDSNSQYFDPQGQPLAESEIAQSQLNTVRFPVVSTDVQIDQDQSADQDPADQPLDVLIPAPLNPGKRNVLEYPVYGIVSPIVYSTQSTFVDANGNPYNDTVGGACSAASQAAPIQQLLKGGIAHVWSSPQPGEAYDSNRHGITNSYIVGHSSDCTRHAYSEIFKALDRNSKVGEEFYIYDRQGRFLRFRVFEVLQILATDDQIAFRQDFGDRRVVTLQTSVLLGGGRIDRWLTRGELILE